MLQLINTALSGLVLGMIFAAFALALVLIWRSTRILNFAQAPMAMVTTYIAVLMVEAGRSYWLSVAVALVCGLVLGALIERIVIRPVEGKADINAVILTLGLFIVIKAAAEVAFTTKLRTFPATFGIRGISFGDTTVGITTSDLFTIGAVVVTMALLVALFRLTDVGLRMRAAASNMEVARLLGVRVGSMLTLGWALAALVGSLSGVLIASGGLVQPSYMDGIVVFGFIAAVIGGLESPTGAVVGGLLLGFALAFVNGYIDSQLTTIFALGILMVVLMLRPGGLFGTAPGRRV